VDQEVSGSIPPNRTILFNGLAEISLSHFLFLGPPLGPILSTLPASPDFARPSTCLGDSGNPFSTRNLFTMNCLADGKRIAQITRVLLHSLNARQSPPEEWVTFRQSALAGQEWDIHCGACGRGAVWRPSEWTSPTAPFHYI
jgi:hypothetical protein